MRVCGYDLTHLKSHGSIIRPPLSPKINTKMIIFSTMQECTSVGMVRGLLVLSLASEEHSSMQPSPEIGNKRKRKGPALPVQFKFFLNSIFEKKTIFEEKKRFFKQNFDFKKCIIYSKTNWCKFKPPRAFYRTSGKLE